MTSYWRRPFLGVLLIATVACSGSPQASAPPPSSPRPSSTPVGSVATPPIVDPTWFPGGTHYRLDGPPGVWFADSLHGWGVDGDCNNPFPAAVDSCAFQAVATLDGGRSWAPVGDVETFSYVPT